MATRQASVVSCEGDESEVRYLKEEYRGKEKVIFEQSTRDAMTQPYKVKLHDARLLPRQPDSIAELKDHGFSLVKFRSSAKTEDIINPPAYQDDKMLQETPEQVRARETYYKEAAELVRKATGADVAFTLTHSVRNQDKISHKDKESEKIDKSVKYLVQYASFAHADFTEEIMRRGSHKFLVKRGVPEDTAKKMKLAFFGLWQPTENPVEMFPLALCHSKSVEPEDGVKTVLNYGLIDEGDKKFSYKPPIRMPTYNSKHQWYIFPNMQTDEAVIIPHCDTREGYPLQTYHCAVKHNIKENPLIRSSVEVRIVCGYLDNEKSKL
mmetsp:Transcript_15728/g.17756  ORF Transcript_15728/g.17756 Transcript_15728/m.17756 type:complete len:323 (-) Transcript_15728:910-1878(-)